MVPIVTHNNPVLRKIAADVPRHMFGTSEFDTIVSDMKKALAGEFDGVALAAPQIGVSLRIFVVSGKMFTEDTDPAQQEDRVFINPVIKKVSRKKIEVEEGCLSVRWKYGLIKRTTNMRIEAWDEKGVPFTYSASGLLAQIFQHEIDHLNGILFTDKATNVRDIDPMTIRKMNNDDHDR